MPSIYILFFLFLLIASLFDYSVDGLIVLPAIVFIFLLCFLVFRFGQGADYFSYYSIFRAAGNYNGSIIGLKNVAHSEIGFLLLCSVVFKLGIPFELFVVFISIVEIICLWRFVNNYCPKRIIACLLAFPTLYLTYFFSALREGIVIAVFLGILIPLLFKRKYVLYYVISLILFTIHSVALILVLLPLWVRIDKKIIDLIISVTICFAIGFIIGYTPVKEFLPYNASNASILAILIRLFEFALIIIITSDVYGTDTKDGALITFMVDCFVLGLLFYALFFSTDLLSSRTMAIFSFVDICIFSIEVKSRNRKSLLSLLLIIYLTSVMFYKNINAYISWSNYKNTTFWNYPYISVFNREKSLEYLELSDYQSFVIPEEKMKFSKSDWQQ